jgi:hypothetical protein
MFIMWVIRICFMLVGCNAGDALYQYTKDFPLEHIPQRAAIALEIIRVLGPAATMGAGLAIGDTVAKVHRRYSN